MVKLKELEGKVKEQLTEIKEGLALGMIEEALLDLKSAERTYNVAKKKYEELLETDLDDLEVDQHDY